MRRMICLEVLDFKMMKKKKRNDIIEGMKPGLTLAGGAMGSSLLGGATQDLMPAGMANPLTTTGATFGRFVGPVAVIGAGGVVLKQLKKTEKKLK